MAILGCTQYSNSPALVTTISLTFVYVLRTAAVAPTQTPTLTGLGNPIEVFTTVASRDISIRYRTSIRNGDDQHAAEQIPTRD